MMTRLALIPCLALPLPALAETPDLWLAEQTMMLTDADPALRMQAGLAACLGAAEAPTPPEQTVEQFAFAEWQRGEWGGLTEFTHDTSSALVAGDGAFCEIADTGLPAGRAAEILRGTFAQAQITGWTEGRNDAGCITYRGPQGRLIEVNSGGQDPVCGETPSSAIRVWNTGDGG